VKNSGVAGKMFQGKPGIFKKPEKHMKKTFRRKMLKNKNMGAKLL
jgi:hypothetical protein